MKRLYVWETRPELARLVGLAILAYLVQIGPGVVDDVSNAADPVKAVIALAIAGAQFVAARVIAAASKSGEPDTP